MKNEFRLLTFFLIFLSPLLVFSQTFKDRAIEMGIDHFALDSNIISGGVAIFDFNNDGFDDLYLNGGENPDKLFENIGGKFFRNISSSSGIAFILKDVNTMGVGSSGYK